MHDGLRPALGKSSYVQMGTKYYIFIIKILITFFQLNKILSDSFIFVLGVALPKSKQNSRSKKIANDCNTQWKEQQ